MPPKPHRAVATYDVMLAVAEEQPESETFLVALATDPEGHDSMPTAAPHYGASPLTRGQGRPGGWVAPA